jgi:hypothetical protein
VGDRPDLEVIEAAEALLAREHQTAQAVAQRVRTALAAEGPSGPRARPGAAPAGQDREGSPMLAFAAQESQAPASLRLPNTISWEPATLGVRGADEVGAAAGAVAASRAAAGYPDGDVRGLRASLPEALRGAVQADPSGEVRALYVVSPQQALAEVQGQGHGQAPARAVTLRRRRAAT